MSLSRASVSSEPSLYIIRTMAAPAFLLSLIMEPIVVERICYVCVCDVFLHVRVPVR